MASKRGKCLSFKSPSKTCDSDSREGQPRAAMLLEIQTPNRPECYLKLTRGVQQPQGHDHPVFWRQALPEDRSSLSQKRWNPNHPLKKKQGEMSTAVTLTVYPLLDPCKKYCPAVFPSHNMKNLSNSFPYEIDLLGFKTFETVRSAGFVTRGLWATRSAT